MPRPVDQDVRRIRAMRLRNQGLVAGSRTWATATEAARGMVAVQAQDLEGAKLGLARRAGGLTIAEVEAELEAFAIVRNRPSRGTLQIATPDDLCWLTARLAGRSLRASERRREDLGVTPAMLAAVEEVVRDQLGAGRSRTRAELVAACAAAGVELDAGQASHSLGHLTQRLVIVLANRSGRADAFVLAEDVIPGRPRVSGDAALAELATRFVDARGPVTPACLSWWANLSVGEVRTGVAAAGAAIEEVVLDGTTLLVTPSTMAIDDSAIDEALATVLLLPAFDEYLLGYRHRSPVVSREDEARIVPGGNGMFKPMVVVDGAIVGTWKRTIRRSSVDVTVDAFATLSRASQRQLGRRVDELGTYLGLEASLTVA